MSLKKWNRKEISATISIDKHTGTTKDKDDLIFRTSSDLHWAFEECRKKLTWLEGEIFEKEMPKSEDILFLLHMGVNLREIIKEITELQSYNQKSV